MPRYEVNFTFETSMLIEVEAADPTAAITAAQAEMNKYEVDHLPEMWPSDFVADGVELIVD